MAQKYSEQDLQKQISSYNESQKKRYSKVTASTTNSTTAPYVKSKTPSMQEYVDTFEKYVPNWKTKYGYSSKDQDDISRASQGLPSKKLIKMYDFKDPNDVKRFEMGIPSKKIYLERQVDYYKNKEKADEKERLAKIEEAAKLQAQKIDDDKKALLNENFAAQRDNIMRRAIELGENYDDDAFLQDLRDNQLYAAVLQDRYNAEGRKVTEKAPEEMTQAQIMSAAFSDQNPEKKTYKSKYGVTLDVMDLTEIQAMLKNRESQKAKEQDHINPAQYAVKKQADATLNGKPVTTPEKTVGYGIRAGDNFSRDQVEETLNKNQQQRVARKEQIDAERQREAEARKVIRSVDTDKRIGPKGTFAGTGDKKKLAPEKKQEIVSALSETGISPSQALRYMQRDNYAISAEEISEAAYYEAIPPEANAPSYDEYKRIKEEEKKNVDNRIYSQAEEIKPMLSNAVNPLDTVRAFGGGPVDNLKSAEVNPAVEEVRKYLESKGYSGVEQEAILQMAGGYTTGGAVKSFYEEVLYPEMQQRKAAGEKIDPAYDNPQYEDFIKARTGKGNFWGIDELAAMKDIERRYWANDMAYAPTSTKVARGVELTPGRIATGLVNDINTGVNALGYLVDPYQPDNPTVAGLNETAGIYQQASQTGVAAIDIGFAVIDEAVKMYALAGAGSALAGAGGMSASTLRAAKIGTMIARKTPFVLRSVGSSFTQAISEGASREEAATFALCAGLVGGIIEEMGADNAINSKLSGWAQTFFKGNAQNAFTRVINSPYGRKFIQIIAASGGEALEEGVEYLSSGLISAVTHNPAWAPDLKELGSNMGMGALVGGFIGALASGENTLSNKTVQQMIDVGHIDEQAATQLITFLNAEERIPDAVKADPARMDAHVAKMAEGPTDIDALQKNYEKMLAADVELLTISDTAAAAIKAGFDEWMQAHASVVLNPTETNIRSAERSFQAYKSIEAAEGVKVQSAQRQTEIKKAKTTADIEAYEDAAYKYAYNATNYGEAYLGETPLQPQTVQAQPETAPQQMEIELATQQETQRPEASRYPDAQPIDQASVDTYIDNALQKISQPTTQVLREVTADEAADIMDATGIDVRGYTHVLTDNDIRHVMNNHSDSRREAKRGQLPVTVDDIRKIPYIINNYDSITEGSIGTKNRKSIIYSKRVNGTIWFVEAVNTEGNALAAKTMWKKPSARMDANIPHHTSETASSGSFDNNTIPQQPTNTQVQKTEIRSPQDIFTRLGEHFGITITSERYPRALRGGKQGVRDAKGYWKSVEVAPVYGVTTPTGEALTLVANDTKAIAHEMGHKFNREYHFADTNTDLVNAMVDKLPDGFTANYKPEQLQSEAIAEFTRLYLNNPADAREFGGAFYDVFESAFSKTDLRELRNASELLQQFHAADIGNKIESTITQRGKEKYLSKESRFADVLERAEAYLFDDLVTLRKFDEQGKKSGVITSADQEAYKLALFSRRAGLQAGRIITHNLIDVEGNVISDGMKRSIGNIKPKEFDLFDAYLKAKHAVDWQSQGKRVYGDEITANDNQAFVDKIEAEMPQFVEAANKLYKFWDQFMQTWVVNTGMMPQDSYDELKEMYPHYVPMDRSLPKGRNRSGNAKSGFNNQKVSIKRAKGSAYDTYSPLESMMVKIDAIVQTVRRVEVARALDGTYQREKSAGVSAGDFIHEIEKDMLPASFDTRSIKDQIAYTISRELGDGKITKKSYRQDAKTAEELRTVMDSVVDNFVMQFQQKNFAGANDILTVVREDGTTAWYKIDDPELMRAISALAPKEIPRWLNAFGNVTQTMKSLTTGLNPFFALQSNLFRDLSEGLTWSETRHNPIKYYAEYAKAGFDAAKSGKVESAELEAFKNMGGGGGYSLTDQRDIVKTLLQEVGLRKNNAFNWSKTKLENFNDVIESASRLAEFGRGDLSTYAGRIEALMASEELTTNFTKHGEGAQSIGKIIPFYNAGMQGLYKLVRAATPGSGMTPKQRTSIFAKSIAYLLLPTLLQEFLYKDDEGYQRTPQRIKDAYFLIKNDNGTFTRIPKPKGPLTFMTSGLPLRVLNAMEGKADKSDTLAAAIWDALSPASGFIFDPVIGIGANRSWTGAPIESDYLRELPIEERYDETTSWFGKTIASDVISPKQADYLIKQYGGFIADLLLPATQGRAQNAEDVLTALGDTIKRRNVIDPAYSNNVESNFYDGHTELQQKITSAKRGDRKKELAALQKIEKLYATARKDVAEKNKQIRKLQDDKKLSRKERDDKIRALRLLRIGIEEGAMQKIDAEMKKAKEKGLIK